MSSNQIAQAKKNSLQIVQEMIRRLKAQKKLPGEKSQGVYKTPKWSKKIKKTSQYPYTILI